MSTNKHQIIRYTKLDRCFQNYGREYIFENLLEAVNEYLMEYNPKVTESKLEL